MRHLNTVSALVVAILFLTSCITTGSQPAATADQPPGALSQDLAGPPAPGEVGEVKAVPPQKLRPVKVGILLPLSGDHAQLGDAMLKAAQLALFDVGYEGFELVPRDTGSTPQQAQDAARSAIAEGAEILLGPLFADSVAAVKPIAASSSINIISFTTDQSQAGGNVFVMGFLPYDQISRIVQFAAGKNLRRVSVLAPTSEYGQIASRAFNDAASRAGVQTVDTQRFNPQSQNLSDSVRALTKIDQLQQPGQQNIPNYNNIAYDAVFMPMGGDNAKMAGNLLAQYGLPPSRVKRLGTGLFDDATLIHEPGLEGAWFAAPSPNSRASFENRYKDSFGNPPPRLSTLAYDATALAAVLAQRGLGSPAAKPAFDHDSISNPNGFAGIDGIFRFRPDGTAERGLAVLEIRRNGIAVLEEAPKTFQPYAPF